MIRSCGLCAALALLVTSGIGACSAHDDDEARPDAARDGVAQADPAGAASDTTGDDATFSVSSASAGGHDASSAITHSTWDAAVAPPPMACDADASDDAYASYCPPPLSICADATHLAYFDWGTCVSGQCVWPQKIMACPTSGTCTNGACISHFTAPM